MSKLDNLCGQCTFVFSQEGLQQLFTSHGVRHSKVVTFESRPNCPLCSYLWNKNFVGSSNQPQSIRRLRDFIAPETYLSRPRSFQQAAQGWVVLQAPESHYAKWEHLSLRVESEAGRLLWQTHHPLRVIASKAGPYADLTRLRPLEWNGLTTEWAAALRSLISECENSQKLHNYCELQYSTPLPTRVLRIIGYERPVPRVSLHVTPEEGQVGRYAALSYCWGGPQEVSLTRENLYDLQRGPLDSASLPQTFKDAILTTQMLGLEYLWIDALCIIQNDPVDKAREITRMCSIYENSIVTIVAATASSVRDGFLKPVSIFNERYPSCEIQVSLEGNNPSTLTFTPLHTHHTDDFPINKRGWTFQEASIPPRLLVFGDLEPFFRCRSGDVVTVSKTCIRYDRMSRMKPRRLVNRHVKIDGRSINDIEDSLSSIWPEVVEEYTSRDLSFAEDRPLAAGGVIDFLSGIFHDKCYFGVWASCPIACLLWQKTYSGRESVAIPGLPTWSWMSITGQVDLYHMILLGNHNGEANVEFDEDPSHQRIFLTCCVVREEDVREARDVTEFHPDHSEMESRGMIAVAAAASDDGGFQDLFLLVLTKTTDRKLLAVIATHEGSNTYRRWGLMEIKNPDRWLSNPKRKVVLQ
ncbi:heterokaryon incompatibility protein-domain-containing protein [Camillea tinctor]|nr:heterokaryon incompatibility protein-domain-containing protein [Camillea tinctor]